VIEAAVIEAAVAALSQLPVLNMAASTRAEGGASFSVEARR
jgi:hypothetical protein